MGLSLLAAVAWDTSWTTCYASLTCFCKAAYVAIGTHFPITFISLEHAGCCGNWNYCDLHLWR